MHADSVFTPTGTHTSEDSCQLTGALKKSGKMSSTTTSLQSLPPLPPIVKGSVWAGLRVNERLCPDDKLQVQCPSFDVHSSKQLLLATQHASSVGRKLRPQRGYPNPPLHSTNYSLKGEAAAAITRVPSGIFAFSTDLNQAQGRCESRGSGWGEEKS